MNAGDQNNFLMKNREIRNLTPLLLSQKPELSDSWKFLEFWGHPRDLAHYGNVKNTVYARILGDSHMARVSYWKFPNLGSIDDHSQNIINIWQKLTEHEKIWNVFFFISLHGSGVNNNTSNLHWSKCFFQESSQNRK